LRIHRQKPEHIADGNGAAIAPLRWGAPESFRSATYPALPDPTAVFSRFSNPHDACAALPARHRATSRV